jgi:hypothetical protein
MIEEIRVDVSGLFQSIGPVDRNTEAKSASGRMAPPPSMLHNFNSVTNRFCALWWPQGRLDAALAPCTGRAAKA